MFGLGIIRHYYRYGRGCNGCLALKEVCKMKKKKDQISKTESDIVDPEK